MAWHGTARHGMAWHDTARHGTAWHGTARHGMAWHGMAWHGVMHHDRHDAGHAQQYGTTAHIFSRWEYANGRAVDMGGSITSAEDDYGGDEEG